MALATVWNGVLDVMYPTRCLVCGRLTEHEVLCRACIAQFKPLVGSFCERCGTPAFGPRPLCEGCDAGREPPYAWTHALGMYQGTLRQAIHRLKYDGKTALASPLGLLLARSLLNATPHGKGSSDSLHFDVVVPVPLHPARQRQRGFNQAERIACFLALECGWPLDANGLRRPLRTHSQTRLDAYERASNVRGAFMSATPSRFVGKSVCLVDDVITTTATVRACSDALLQAGAAHVEVVALARG